MPENATNWSSTAQRQLLKSFEAIDDQADARWRKLKTRLGMKEMGFIDSEWLVAICQDVLKEQTV